MIDNQLENVITKLEPLENDDLRNASFKCELHQWYLKWESMKSDHGVEALPTSLAHTLPHASSYYTNIGILLRILCTLPVTSCSPDRSFSALK